MRKERKILYLDQFAVSNMYNAAPTSAWGMLRHTIQEKVSKGVLSCPMPLEHLYETVGRSNKDKTGNQNEEYSRKIIEQHDFFRELANGTAFYGYEEIAATEIIMLLRQGKINPTKAIYLHKAPYAQIDISDIYDEGHAFNEDNHIYNRNLSQGVNELREITQPLNNDIRTKQKKSIDPLLQKAIVRSLVDSYIVGLKGFCQKGYVKVRGVNCGTFEGLHKVDLLIYKLTKKRINKRETEKLIKEFETNGFDRIPSMNIHSVLSADLALFDKQQVPNDEIDIDRAAVGLRISDYFFADNEKKLTIEKYRLDRQYQTKVYSGKKDSVMSLTEELSSL
jgi:hypothetical protein